MVEQMAKHWEPFERFVLAANRADAGALAAQRHLGVDLGDYVCALLEKRPSLGWHPIRDSGRMNVTANFSLNPDASPAALTRRPLGAG
jgi:hypothetical protein